MRQNAASVFLQIPYKGVLHGTFMKSMSFAVSKENYAKLSRASHKMCIKKLFELSEVRNNTKYEEGTELHTYHC